MSRPCLLLSAVSLLVFASSARAEPAWMAVGFTRKTIYHSPQKPGYTCWVGAWMMPDKSVMIGFTQATGPVKGRSQAPAELWKKLGMSDRGWDFTGLNRTQIYLRSTDEGLHWTKTAETPFGGVGASAFAGGATIGLEDGTILRRVNGWDLMGEPNIPYTAFLQKSSDLGQTWSKPQVLLDPHQFLYQLSRIRRLRDGRLLATGQYWPAPAGVSHQELDKLRPQLLLMTSGDGGKSWDRREVLGKEHSDVVWDEWDCAELDKGDLLCIFRRGDPTNLHHEIRWQGILKKNDQSWSLFNFEKSILPHSGHPELLATREGIILYFATTGVEWTSDRGKNWHHLEAPGFPGYKTRYYPRSLQLDDGTILVFGHNGWDNRYGEFDQSIDMDRFVLKRK
jgi:hypothetical protein